jgi:hypothetical protein
MLSALQLDDYVVDTFHLETNSRYLTNPDEAEALEEDEQGDEIGYGLDLFPSSEPDRILGLRLFVDVNGDVEDWTESHRYRARISVTGQFEFRDDPEDRPPADELYHFFMRSGISILYGIARTRIAEATSGQPYSKLVLPTMDFTPAIEDVRDSLEEDQKDYFRRLAPPNSGQDD